MFNKKTQISASVPDDMLQKYFHSISNEKIICRAPLTSLYFNPDGEVGACCLNKGSYYYGKYPEQSIKEILNSVPRKLHQKYLHSNNLLAGCNICQENILAGNTSGILATGYKNQSIKKHITRVDFELSNYCNINCIMCARDKTKQDLIYNDKFIDEIKPYLKKIEFANFVGGEPFAIELYYKIWDIILINNPSCKIIVQTNGTIINNKIINYLNNPNFCIGISIDALNEKTFNYIRKGAELDYVLQNFDTFNSIMQKKNHRMQISVCPMRINWQEIPKLFEFANKNACHIYFNYVEYPDNLSLKQTPSFFLQNIIEELTKIINSTVLKNDTSCKNSESLNGLISLLVSWKRDAIKKEHNSSLVTKRNLSKLLLQKIDINHKEFIVSLINEMPESWFIGNEKLKQIEKFDFNKQLSIFYSENKTSTDILTEAKRFFEINRIENITYE
ncbi:MAG: radical SAM protein [Bacteroidales bacterium]|nr:radical SAM protein [Bacteroidales bacterium]